MIVSVGRYSLCELSASGTTNTPARVHDWVNRAVLEARKALRGTTATARVWPYAHDGTEFLGCSICGGDASGLLGYALTFVIGSDVDLTYACEPHVPTMADALHMVGIVLATIGASIAIGRHR